MEKKNKRSIKILKNNYMELKAITYNYTQDGVLWNKVVGIFKKDQLESALNDIRNGFGSDKKLVVDLTMLTEAIFIQVTILLVSCYYNIAFICCYGFVLMSHNGLVYEKVCSDELSN